MKRIFLSFALLLLVPGVSGCERRAGPDVVSAPSDEACLLTADALRDLLVRQAGEPQWRWILATEPAPVNTGRLSVETVLAEEGEGWTSRGDRIAGPSVAMAEAFVRRRPVGGGDCRSVIEQARRSHVALKPAPFGLDFVLRPKSIGIEKAVLSPDGKEAIAYASFVGDGFDAMGGLALFRKRDDGVWRHVGDLGLWAS